MTDDVTTPCLIGNTTHTLDMWVPNNFGGGWLTLWVEPSDPTDKVEIRWLRAIGSGNSPPQVSLNGHIEGEKIRIQFRPKILQVNLSGACHHVKATLVMRFEEA